jgi:hypothetical protein
MEHVNRREGRVVSVETSEGQLPASVVILAPGHSARDLYENLLDDGVLLEQKPFQMGFRVEHPQDYVNSVIYGKSGVADRFGPADYRLLTKIEGEGIFSFCMCPGGEIIPAVHDSTHFNTNGMSYFKRDTGFANSGIVTTLQPHEFGGSHPLDGIRIQEKYEARAAGLTIFWQVFGRPLFPRPAAGPGSDPLTSPGLYRNSSPHGFEPPLSDLGSRCRAFSPMMASSVGRRRALQHPFGSSGIARRSRQRGLMDSIRWARALGRQVESSALRSMDGAAQRP